VIVPVNPSAVNGVGLIEIFCFVLTVCVDGVSDALTAGVAAKIADGALLTGVVVVAITSTK
jgi:hypothetical protein